jgi:hypothetical protein
LPQQPYPPGSQPPGGQYPNYQQSAPSAPWVGRTPPPEEEPLLGLFSRRDLVTVGAGGVVGVLLGAGGSSLINRFSASKPPVYYWAYVTEDSQKRASAVVRQMGTTAPQTIPLSESFLGFHVKLASADVVTNRTAADYLAVAVSQFIGTWTLIYWTPSQLKAFPNVSSPPRSQRIPLTLKTGTMEQVYDVRVLADQNGVGQAIAVAGTDKDGNPQVVWVSLPSGAQSQPQVQFIAVRDGSVTDLNFSGPTVMGIDNLLGLRIKTASGQTTELVIVNSIAPAPTLAPTSAPTTTTSPTVSPTVSPSPTRTPKPKG